MALSRIRTLEGLSIEHFAPQAIRAHAAVVQFYRDNCAASATILEDSATDALLQRFAHQSAPRKSQARGAYPKRGRYTK